MKIVWSNYSSIVAAGLDYAGCRCGHMACEWKAHLQAYMHCHAKFTAPTLNDIVLDRGLIN